MLLIDLALIELEHLGLQRCIVVYETGLRRGVLIDRSSEVLQFKHVNIMFWVYKLNLNNINACLKCLYICCSTTTL